MEVCRRDVRFADIDAGGVEQPGEIAQHPVGDHAGPTADTLVVALRFRHRLLEVAGADGCGGEQIRLVRAKAVLFDQPCALRVGQLG